MVCISANNICHALGKDNKIATKVKLPEQLKFETLDCYCNTMKPGNKISDIDKSRLNPATGPVYFEGVKAGDVLEITIEKIVCNSPGLSFCGVGEGLLAEESSVEELRFYPHDGKMIDFGNNLFLPTNPMIGVIGVAAKDEAVPTASPGDHGGNMDTSLIKEGATLFLPVFHEGGLLAVGDLHAAMGDGEAFYEGVEVSGEAQMLVKVRRDIHIDIPFVKADGKFASIATAETVDLSLKKAMSKLVHFIVNHSQMNFTDASFIVGFYGNLEISQVVDPVMTSRMSISLNILREIGITI